MRRGGSMAEQPRISQLVVVGASARGVEALSTLVATAPGDFPAAFSYPFGASGGLWPWLRGRGGEA